MPAVLSAIAKDYWQYFEFSQKAGCSQMGTGRKWEWRSCRGALPGHVNVCHWNMICRSQLKEHNTDLTDFLVYCTLSDSEYVLWRGWEWNEMKPGEMLTQIVTYCTHMAAMFLWTIHCSAENLEVFSISFVCFIWKYGSGKTDFSGLRGGVWEKKCDMEQMDHLLCTVWNPEQTNWTASRWMKYEKTLGDLPTPHPQYEYFWVNTVVMICGDENAARSWFYTHLDVLDQ